MSARNRTLFNICLLTPTNSLC